MENVDKIALVDAALAGQAPERVPFSIWHHFPASARAGKACADAHLENYRRWDLDYLVVMNDNPYDMPSAMPVITLAKEWLKLEVLTGDELGFRGELEALSRIQRAIGSEARFVVTVPNPIATAMAISNGKAVRHLREDPEAVEQGLSVIAGSLAVFSRKAVDVGASGIYLSCSGQGPSMLSAEEYRRFVKPYDVEILSSVADAPFNVLGLPESEVDAELFLDYPAAAINWSSHHSNCDIPKMRALTDKCLMAGIDERGPIVEGKMRATIVEVSDALSQAGKEGFMVAPECLVPPETSPDLIVAIRDLVAQL